MKKALKVDYLTPLDPANDKDWRNHNLANVEVINDLVYNYFIQSPRCLSKIPNTVANDNCIDGCPFEECHLRIHDKDNWTVETASNEEYNILISRAELVWNYHNKIPFILRTGNWCGLTMHHKNGIHNDDGFENLAFVTRKEHFKIEGRLRSIEAHIRRADLLVTETGHPEAKKLVKNLKGMYKRERDSIKNSEVVPKIINEQIIKFTLNTEFLKG